MFLKMIINEYDISIYYFGQILDLKSSMYNDAASLNVLSW